MIKSPAVPRYHSHWRVADPRAGSYSPSVSGVIWLAWLLVS